VAKKTLSPEARREAIRATVEVEYEKGTALPAVRRILAETLGGDADLYLGTADPVYYRLAGLANPLSDPKGSPLSATPSAVSLRTAVRRRRDAGVRWETLAASTEATLGRPVSVREAKALYAKGGGDREASYVGRGTRRGAPKTLPDAAVAVEVATTGEAEA
jgi:hypothetical protein